MSWKSKGHFHRLPRQFKPLRITSESLENYPSKATEELKLTFETLELITQEVMTTTKEIL